MTFLNVHFDSARDTSWKDDTSTLRVTFNILTLLAERRTESIRLYCSLADHINLFKVTRARVYLPRTSVAECDEPGI